MGLGSEQRVLEQMLQAKEQLQISIECCDKFISEEGFKRLILALKDIERAIEQQEKKCEGLEYLLISFYDEDRRNFIKKSNINNFKEFIAKTVNKFIKIKKIDDELDKRFDIITIKIEINRGSTNKDDLLENICKEIENKGIKIFTINIE